MHSQTSKLGFSQGSQQTDCTVDVFISVRMRTACVQSTGNDGERAFFIFDIMPTTTLQNGVFRIVHTYTPYSRGTSSMYTCNVKVAWQACIIVCKCSHVKSTCNSQIKATKHLSLKPSDYGILLFFPLHEHPSPLTVSF